MFKVFKFGVVIYRLNPFRYCSVKCRILFKIGVIISFIMIKMNLSIKECEI